MFTEIDAYPRSRYDVVADERRQERIEKWLRAQNADVKVESTVKYLIWTLPFAMANRIPDLQDYIASEGGTYQFRHNTNSVLFIVPRSWWATQWVMRLPWIQVGLVGMMMMIWIVYYLR